MDAGELLGGKHFYHIVQRQQRYNLPAFCMKINIIARTFNKIDVIKCDIFITM
jgi:hypothetical protein